MEYLVFYLNETAILYPECSAEKFLFFNSSTKLFKFVEDIACYPMKSFVLKY